MLPSALPSRKSALCVRAVTQTAPFRDVSIAECTFPSHRDRRMRFSVECAFPHLRKRRATSRKSALWPRCLTEKRILAPMPHVKAHSATGTSRKSALWMRTSPKDALWMRAATQNASFRDVSVAECVFPSHRDHRMRFSVECAFSHLRKRRATSRKSALCPRCLTEKRILCTVSHGKAHSVCGVSRKSAFCVRCLTEKRILEVSPSRKSALCLRTSPKDALCMENTRASRAFPP